VVSGSWDNTVKVWAESGGTWSCTDTLQGHIGPVYSVAVLPDGRVVSGSRDATVKVWAESGGTWSCTDTLQGHTDGVTSVAVLPDGRLVSGFYMIKVWEWVSVSTGRRQREDSGGGPRTRRRFDTPIPNDELFNNGYPLQESKGSDNPNEEEASKENEERIDMQYWIADRERRARLLRERGKEHHRYKKLLNDIKTASEQGGDVDAAKDRLIQYENLEGSKQALLGQEVINQRATSEKCGICLGDFSAAEIQDDGYAVQLRCGHWFHKNCIVKHQRIKTITTNYQNGTGTWYKVPDTLQCPLCREPALDNSFGDDVYRLNINLRF